MCFLVDNSAYDIENAEHTLCFCGGNGGKCALSLKGWLVLQSLYLREDPCEDFNTLVE